MSEQKIAYSLSFRDVIRVLRAVDETPFGELQLELEGLKLRVLRDEQAPARQAAAPDRGTAQAAASGPGREQIAAAARAVTSAVTGAQGTPVVAPLAGTFYRSPYPGEPPFVEVGAAVKQGDVVAIVEIMKLMNHVTAPCSGVIREIRARNEQAVEYGQVLAVIDPEPVA